MSRSREIEVLVRGVCVKAGRLLVCETKGAANTYLPGGHVEFNERAVDSLRRELAEELGVRAKVGAFLGALEHSFRQQGQRHCEINLVFRVAMPALDWRRPPPAREHWVTFRWVSLRRLGQARLEPWPLRRLLPQWLKHGGAGRCWASTLPTGGSYRRPERGKRR